LQKKIDLLFRHDRYQPKFAFLMDQIVFHKNRVLG
jgi:hypothetical protein